MKLIDRDYLLKNGHKVAENGSTAQGRRFPRLPRFPLWYYAVAAVFVVAVVAGLLLNGRSGSQSQYVTQAVVRQDLIAAVTASGTLNPQDTVSIGTQDSGTINQIFVDFNSVVKKGQVLATLDPQPFQVALNQAEANLAQTVAQAQAAGATAQGSLSNVQAAQASAQAAQAQVSVVRANAAASAAAVQTSDADVTKAQSALALAQQTVNRDTSLLSQGYITQAQADTDRTGLVAAQSALRSAQAVAQQTRLQATAALSQMQASADTSRQQMALGAQSVSQASQTAASRDASQAAIGIQQAQVETARLNLQRAVITSPVDGTVIARNVSIGQTVAASFQTPTLFSIAQDLRRMEADVAVGEPDIGSVKQGDIVDFTVLAYPTRTFHGYVKQVRQSPTVTSNVVTYTTVVLVSNQDGALRPGMTANASIHVAKAANALVVPVEALQWRPAGAAGARRTRRGATPSASGAPSAGAAGGGSSQRSAWGQLNGANARGTTAGSRGAIFVLSNGKAQRIPVTIGLISGAQAAVTPLGSATLKAGDEVIVSDSSQRAATTTSQAVRSPLAPSGGGPRVGGGLR
jgi:HlyD family secretion protein